MADLKDWVTTASTPMFDGAPWVSVSSETVQLPDGKTVDGFYWVKMRDFVCIYPVTENGSGQVINQYKHGPQRVSLTFPGGHIEDGEDRSRRRRANCSRKRVTRPARSSIWVAILSAPIRNAGSRTSCGRRDVEK